MTAQKPAAPGASGDMVADIEKFQKHFGFDKVQTTLKFLRNQLDFFKEEVEELEQALVNGDAASAYDAVIDLLVVGVGTAEFMAQGKTREGWTRVMNKNFQKQIGYNDKRPNSGGVDLIKPEGWTPPDHSDLVTRLKEILTSAPDEFRRTVFTQSNGKAEGEAPEREAIKVLLEAAELMRKKSQDYVNPNSSVKAADYYPNGASDFVHLIDVAKRMRQTSLLEAYEATGYSPNNEALDDTLMDRINYLALWIEWNRGKTPGQLPGRDIFNRPERRQEVRNE